MGGGTFSHSAYDSFTSSTRGLHRDDVFKSRGIHKDLDPNGVKMRESRDSAEHPASNAIILALDVTGSMGQYADIIARQQMGPIMNRLFDDGLIADPQIMFMGIGDARCDRAPLQVSQFESDNRIVEQLTQLWLESGGGGNLSESYTFPWYFAAQHTSIDCFEKRGRKGYLFTFGDEESPETLTAGQIELFLGYKPQHDYNPLQLVQMAEEKYHLYHIIIGEGSHARSRPDAVRETWKMLLGQRALWLNDHTKLGDGICSIIKMNEEAMGYGKSTAATALPGYMALLR